MRVALALANIALISAACAKEPSSDLKPNVAEMIDTIEGPRSKALTVGRPRSELEALERAAVANTYKRLGPDLGHVPVTARSTEEIIGNIVVLRTETSLYGHVALVEIAGVIDGRFSTIICRASRNSYIDYPASECARRVNAHFVVQKSDGAAPHG